jgi:hypothetical protein
MSVVGPKCEYSPGAHVFRVSPDNGHAAAKQKPTLCAMFRTDASQQIRGGISTSYAARSTRLSISMRSVPKSIGLV